ncbi:hypothetical protein QJS10_CPB14g00564 [Acorus calamus]|uniref:Uncharacterized protein n=1 Tax=Acorus calamus TaxID=4465 RepID=A0AAV9DDM1_ACOCL|nr:hypothetical protein QJS10_CPB14g00564 [Acorus calamus]
MAELLNKSQELRLVDMRQMIVSPPPPRVFHNFEMPMLKWGNQRLVRYVKVRDGSDIYWLIKRVA